MPAKRAFCCAVFCAFAVATLAGARATPAGLGEILANDNRIAAGTLAGGTLNLSLDARVGNWFPDGPGKDSVPVEAFAESGKPLQIPGPLVRVPAGTSVVATVRNSIAGTVLTIKGIAD